MAGIGDEDRDKLQTCNTLRLIEAVDEVDALRGMLGRGLLPARCLPKWRHRVQVDLCPMTGRSKRAVQTGVRTEPSLLRRDPSDSGCVLVSYRAVLRGRAFSPYIKLRVAFSICGIVMTAAADGISGGLYLGGFRRAFSGG